MNEFLKYLSDKLVEEIETVRELLSLDNKIQYTNLTAEELNAFLNKNILQKKLLDIDINNNTIVLTEGDPFVIVKLFNDFSNKIKKIYLSNSYIAINRWLYTKYLNYYKDMAVDIKTELDFEKTYIHYYDSKENIFVIGTNEFIQTTEEDFER